MRRQHLAASIFHFGEYTVGEVKEYLWDGGCMSGCSIAEATAAGA